MIQINKADKDGLITLDFDGYIMAECKIVDNNIVVIRAVNSWGEELNFN